MPLTRGQRLRRLREQKGVEQQVAAPGIGISRPYLSLLEHDEKGRNVDHLRTTFEKAAAYYGVMPEYLLAETPQEYIVAFVRALGAGGPLTTGRRLAMVLHELHLRWGDDFTLSQVAESLGTTAGALEDLMSDRISLTASLAEQLGRVTGAPVDWLVLRPATDTQREAELQRIVKMAFDSGVEPGELEKLVQIWLSARNTKAPSGT